MASVDVLSSSPGGGAIDVSRLSNFLSLPEDVISSFAGITGDYVTSVLRAIDNKSREHDNLRADALRIEVELEQAVRTADNRVKAMKTQLDSSLAETQDLRSKLNTSGLFILPVWTAYVGRIYLDTVNVITIQKPLVAHSRRIL